MGNDLSKQLQVKEENTKHHSGKSSEQKITISKGPQFKTLGGEFLALLFLLFVFISLFALTGGFFIVSLLFFIAGIALFSLVLDIQGIQVDRNLHKIRNYKVFLWFKFGTWDNINNYKSIYLTHKNITVKTSFYSNNNSETHHYYHINLVDEPNKKKILLAEYKNYYKAHKIAQNIANATGLSFKDYIKGKN